MSQVSNVAATVALLALAACKPINVDFSGTANLQSRGGVVAFTPLEDGRLDFGNAGATGRQATGVRGQRPSLAELDTWQDSAVWVSYLPTRSCFGLVDYTYTDSDFAVGDGVKSIIRPPDYAHETFRIVTPSTGEKGITAVPHVTTAALQVNYESYYVDRWVPAVDHWIRNVVDVCFDTPTPLAQEPWVKFRFTNKNAAKAGAVVTVTFAVQGGGAQVGMIAPRVSYE